jgi:hypothetical protein
MLRVDGYSEEEEMATEFSLDEALGRVATIGECHWTKAWFAAGRLVRRLPALRGAVLEAVRNSDWESAPQCTGPVVDGMLRPERFAAGRGLRLIARGLFPAAYVAAHDWVGEARTPAEGFARLVDTLKARAVNESGHLGHGFSIWAGYADLAESGLLHDAPRRTRMATERFAEFVAQALPGYPVGENDWAVAPFGEAAPRRLSQVLDRVLEGPGFFGHNLILLSHALRYRPKLSDDHWHRLLAQAEAAVKDALSENTGGRPETAGHSEDLDSADLEAALVRHLRRKPGNVHRVTLCDATLTLVEVANLRQQGGLVELLDAY